MGRGLVLVIVLGFVAGCGRTPLYESTSYRLTQAPEELADWLDKCHKEGDAETCRSIAATLAKTEDMLFVQRSLLKRACERDDVQGCYGYGVMVRDGVGGPSHAVTGQALIEGACAAGHARACE